MRRRRSGGDHKPPMKNKSPLPPYNGPTAADCARPRLDNGSTPRCFPTFNSSHDFPRAPSPWDLVGIGLVALC